MDISRKNYIIIFTTIFHSSEGREGGGDASKTEANLFYFPYIYRDFVSDRPNFDQTPRECTLARRAIGDFEGKRVEFGERDEQEEIVKELEDKTSPARHLVPVSTSVAATPRGARESPEGKEEKEKRETM